MKEPDEIEFDYKKAQDVLNKLYIDLPSMTEKAVNLASEALKVNNEYTYKDDEIDHFLPPALRGGVQ